MKIFPGFQINLCYLQIRISISGINESEMLQQAIQMSTRDYIDDQKRKYFCGP